MRIPAFVLCAALVACQTAGGKRITAVQSYQPPATQGEEALLAAAGFPAASVGFALADARTCEVLAVREGGRGFLTASVAKVATAAAALEVLGPQRTFETRLVRTGTLREGTLEGDLYLIGGADPQLGAPSLLELAQRLRQSGIARVRGALYFDTSGYAGTARIDPLQDSDASSDPAISSLAADLNRITVRWQPLPGGAVQAWAQSPLPVTVKLSPQPLTTAFARAPGEGGERWLLASDAPQQGNTRLPLAHPAEAAARLFALFAHGVGIELPDPLPGSAPSLGTTPVASVVSPPLHQLVRALLTASSNPMAEMVLLALAQKTDPQARTLEEAGAALELLWSRWLPEELRSGLHLANGSGLTGENRVSPLQMVAMLRRAAALPEGPPFVALLAAGGASGTLSNRFTTPDAALRVWAKTGTMDFASALAGFLYTRSGRELIFVAFVNDLDQRRQRDDHLPRSLAEARSLEAQRSAWAARAESLLDALATSFIARY